MRQEFWSDPHVAELRNQQAEALAREVELASALALFLEKHRAVHIHENDQQAKWEVWNGLVDAVDFLDLIVEEFEHFMSWEPLGC